MRDDLIAKARAILTGQVIPEHDLEAVAALVEGLGPEGRGVLLPLSYGVWLTGDAAPSRFAMALADQIDSSRDPSVVGAQAFEAAVEALVAASRRLAPPEWRNPQWSAEEVRDMRLGGAAWRLIAGLQDEGLSDRARAGLDLLLPMIGTGAASDRLQAVVAARLAGNPAAEQRAVDRLMARVEGELEARETALILAEPVLRLRDWCRNRSSFRAEPEDLHAERMRLLDGMAGYPAFAVEVVQTGLDRLGAIAAKQTAYRPDGAFPLGDCKVIAGAMLWGLHHGADWALSAIGPLWQMAIQAPDPGVRTMPSQSLSIGLGHAAVTEPRPEGLRALDAAAAACRHAGVAKKLERFRKAARVALAAHPERLLALDPGAPLAKDMVKPFAAAVEGLLARPEPMAAPDWRVRLGPGRKEAWALSRALMWEVTPGDGAPPFTALPEKAGGWRDVTGVLRDFSEGDAIRLWHPVETPADLARAWRMVLERQGISQPFVQAGREVYPITAAERDGREATRFVGRPVAAVPMIGLARVSGWRLGYRSDLHLTLAGCRFVLEAGVAVYPGAAGTGGAGPLRLVGPQTRLGQVPARVLSEALRKVDLLVSVGGRGLA